jgi:hypothetical protein
MTRAVYSGHRCGSRFVTFTIDEARVAIDAGEEAGTRKARAEIAAISRARPTWHTQSPRFDVISKSWRTSRPSETATSSEPSSGNPARVSSSACSVAEAGGSR